MLVSVLNNSNIMIRRLSNIENLSASPYLGLIVPVHTKVSTISTHCGGSGHHDVIFAHKSGLPLAFATITQRPMTGDVSNRLQQRYDCFHWLQNNRRPLSVTGSDSPTSLCFVFYLCFCVWWIIRRLYGFRLVFVISCDFLQFVKLFKVLCFT